MFVKEHYGSTETASRNLSSSMEQLNQQRVTMSRFYKEGESLKHKSPSTPNLNWRQAVAAGPGLMIHNSGQAATEQSGVRRRPKKAGGRVRPRSEVREGGGAPGEEGGEERRRPASYVDSGSKEKDFYLQTCSKPGEAGGGVHRSRAAVPGLPAPLLSGLVWQQASGLFARWREVFLVLTKASNLNIDGFGKIHWQ